MADALFSGRDLPRLAIQIPETAMEVLRTEVRAPGRPPSRANVLVTVREGNITYTNVTLHLKGRNSFRPVDQKPSMTLSFAPNGEGQGFHGLGKLSLNNSVSDAAYACEALGREMFAAAGIPVPRATHAVVELNGRDLGPYVLTEGWDKEFLKRHFSDPDGNLYEHAFWLKDVTFPLPVISGDDPKDRGALQALAVAAREPDASKRWAALGSTLDLEGFITFMAMESLIGHWDGYCRHQNNFKLFHDRALNRMVFLPHGLDQVFGVSKETGGLPFPLLGQMRGAVAAAILETEEGRRRYLERIQQFHTTVFNVGKLTNHVIELTAQLHPFLTNDAFALRSNRVAVERLLERIPRQYNHVGQQLLLLGTPMAPGA